MTDAEIQVTLKAMHDRIGFDREAHSYQVDGEPLVSVTTALKALDKPALLPWAAKLQQEADREAVERWAQAGAFSSLDAALKSVSQAWKKKRDTAADFGTQAHALIEHECRLMLGIYSEEPEVCDEARYIFAGWRRWADDAGFKPLAVETRIYHPVHKYAGTVDVVARFEALSAVAPDRVVVCDWKSSKNLYAEHRLQSAAYREAIEYAGIHLTAGMVVVLPKDKPGKVTPYLLDKRVDDLETAMPAFLGALTAWRWLKDAA